MTDARSQFETRLRRIDRLGRGLGIGALVGLHPERGIDLRRIVGDRHRLLRDEQGMRETGRRHFAGRDDDARAHLGPVPHLDGKRHRHADAAVRRRITRQDAGMHRDTGPGDALHKRHRSAAIDVGMMHLVLLDDAEDTHRRRVRLGAGRNRAFSEEAVGVVDPHPLLFDRDRNDQRANRLGGGFLLGLLGLLVDRTARPLGALRHGVHRPVITGVVVLPIIQRCIRLRGGADDAGCRQNRNLPKTPARTV